MTTKQEKKKQLQASASAPIPQDVMSLTKQPPTKQLPDKTTAKEQTIHGILLSIDIDDRDFAANIQAHYKPSNRQEALDAVYDLLTLGISRRKALDNYSATARSRNKLRTKR